MIQQQLEIPAGDGTADAMLVRADDSTPRPGVIVLTDIYGLRQAFVDMSTRIAEHGYTVLVPNIFYRTATPPVFSQGLTFPSEEATTRLRELTSPLTPDVMVRDGSAYIDFLSRQPGTRDGSMGVVGFCFAGQFALRLAGARPDRIAVAASFHGAGLVTESDQSPHLVLPTVTARLYFGHAENDRGMPAAAIAHLDAALDDWGGQYENETYRGASHGWMVPDRPVYDEVQAERGMSKLMASLDAALRE